MNNEQNFKNHTQIVWGYYLTTGVPILALIGIAIYKAQRYPAERDLWLVLLLVGWILLTMLFRSRSFALKAQDRAIRAEENLRHYLLTGKAIDKRLGLKQLIALRFASDEEFPALAQKAAEQSLAPEAIKREIRNWKGDHHRV